MYRTAGALLVAACTFVASAQTVNLSGTVSNNSGKPITGAIVTLVGQKMADTTDSKGAYLLKLNKVSAHPAPILPKNGQITLTNGIVSLDLSKASSVKIELFDMMGNLLEKVQHDAAAGEYRFNLTQSPFVVSVVLVRVTAGQLSSVYRYLPLQKSGYAIASFSNAATAQHGFTKAQTKIDVLKVTASGYLSADVQLTSYDDTVDVKLDSMTLGKFSFFVTSLKALQELSKSDKGFGGDFRFGKTGPGAGLLGADSICQCIAERSMPGSKVKQWRAFLSVSADAGGKPVNAIDRIGKGPWYDFEERLLAPTLADLISTRPMNGDPAIKNDLPNEDGIPNHRPDPTKPQDDNHHMVTGSDTKGKLVANATCKDWTSVAGTDVASAGFAWPRGGGGGGSQGSNWMSTWTTPGCEAGIWITTSMSGYGKIIGGGGGYGGFYCFALNP